MKTPRITLALTILAGILCGLTSLVTAAHAQTTVPAPTPAYSQAIIPFELRNGSVIVHATVGDRNVECLVDTGTSEIVWPRSLNLEGEPATVQSSDGKTGTLQFHLRTTSGAVLEGEGYILPMVKIDGLNLDRMISDRVDKVDPSTPNEMILGTRAFQQGSLTIDYKNKQLIIRTAGYDVSSTPRARGDALLPFQWFDGAPLGAGRPAVEGAIDGHPILLAIDTGASGMSIPESFYRAHLSDKQLYRGTVGGFGRKPQPAKTVHGLAVSFGDLSIPDQPAALIPTSSPGGLLGYDQLKRFTITIDYPHQKILFVPN